MSYALGGPTPDQLAQANQRVDMLNERLAAQHAIIRQAQEQGFDSRLVSELRATHARLLAQLQNMMDQAPSLSTEAFSEWLNRLEGLTGQVTLLEERSSAALAQAAPRRTAIIAASTLGALAVAGLIGAAIWYASRREPARKYRVRQRRRRRR